MDSIFAALSLDRLVGILSNAVQRNSQNDKYDIILYDGISTEETIRMIGLTSKARFWEFSLLFVPHSPEPKQHMHETKQRLFEHIMFNCFIADCT